VNKPTAASLNRARWAAARIVAQGERKDYRLIFNQPDFVRFYFGGYVLDFKRDEAAPHRIYLVQGYQFPLLTPEDHAWLFTKAEEYMKAAEAAIKRAKSVRRKSQPRKMAEITPACLFDHLPTLRSPTSKQRRKP